MTNSTLGPAWGIVSPQLAVGDEAALLLPAESLVSEVRNGLLDPSGIKDRTDRVEIPRLPAHVLAVDDTEQTLLCSLGPGVANGHACQVMPVSTVDFDAQPDVEWKRKALNHGLVVLFAYDDVFLAAGAARHPARMGDRISLLRRRCAIGVLQCVRASARRPW